MRLPALALVVFACAAGAFAADAIEVSKPWARPTVPGQTTAGVYARIDNPGRTADRLLGASSPVARDVQVHRMAMEGNVMHMREAGPLDVPAGGSLVLAPGGLHVMLTGLKQPLAAGSRFVLTLRFERAGSVTVEVGVGDAPR